MRATTHLLSLFFVSTALFSGFSLAEDIIAQNLYSDEQQPLDPSNGPTTVPAFPVAQLQNQTCRLDLSAELFGGVGEACGHGLDRSRCCPVLAAWLFAAHARSALEVARAPQSDEPMMPDDSQKCVDALQASLHERGIELPRPNASCDAVLCFCGIRLHQISSLSCPAAFDVQNGARNATPTAAVRDLERSCRNASYAGCTRCLHSLDKLKGGRGAAQKASSGGGEERMSKVFGRDCQLMGLTWLLARNKTAYIPTVSAVLRAVLYSAHPPTSQHYLCSPDQDNMPLAVDSLQLDKPDSSAASFLTFTPHSISLLLLLLPLVV